MTIDSKLRKKAKLEKQITLLEGMTDAIWKKSLLIGTLLIASLILAFFALKISKYISIILLILAFITLCYAESYGCSFGFLFIRA